MINDQEDRFFASESLQGVLTPELLEGKRDDKFGLFLSLGESSYKVSRMSEDKNMLEFDFESSARDLEGVLNLEPTQVKIKCSNSDISKDLAGYEVRSSIVNTENGDYRVNLQFIKNQAGLING